MGTAGGSPEPGGLPRVSGGGQPRWRHRRREIYGCKWIQVRVRVRDGLLTGKKRRGSIAVPSGREEKFVGMFLAEREGKESGEESKRWGRAGGQETSSRGAGAMPTARSAARLWQREGRCGVGRARHWGRLVPAGAGRGEELCRARRAGSGDGSRAGNGRGNSRGRAKPSRSRFA